MRGIYQTAIESTYHGSHNCLNITFQLNLLNVKKNEREYYPQGIFSINYLHGNDILTQSDAIHIIISLPKTQFFSASNIRCQIMSTFLE